jgi:hypothetical protein
LRKSYVDLVLHGRESFTQPNQTFKPEKEASTIDSEKSLQNMGSWCGKIAFRPLPK